MDGSPPPEECVVTGAQFKIIPRTPAQEVPFPHTHPQSTPLRQHPRPAPRRLDRQFALLFLLNLSLILIVSAIVIVPELRIQSGTALPTPTAQAAATSRPAPTPTPPFDPSLGAVLPTHRVVAYYAVPYAEPTGLRTHRYYVCRPGQAGGGLWAARSAAPGATGDRSRRECPGRLSRPLVQSQGACSDWGRDKCGSYAH